MRHLLNRRDAAEYLSKHGVRLSPTTLATWVTRGQNLDTLPPQKIAGRCYYRVSDLDRFMGLTPGEVRG